MENPRGLYAAGCRLDPRCLVRGRSRRIMIVRYRPANIRMINRRERASTVLSTVSPAPPNRQHAVLTGRSISESPDVVEIQ